MNLYATPSPQLSVDLTGPVSVEDVVGQLMRQAAERGFPAATHKA